jgi:prevent-host-death family protein
MAIRVTATEAKARILALLDDVAEGQEIEITRHGRMVARIVPAVGPNAMRASLAGVAMTAASDEDLFSTGAEWELG